MFKITHGLSGHKVRGLWARVKQRCHNPKSKLYHKYGARNISLYKSWRNDFKAFYDYVIILPDYGKKSYTLDRINNSGNYEPGNLRWADKHLQTCNSRIRSDNKSGYKGVHFHKGTGKYIAGFRKNGVYTRIGYFKDPKKGYEARVKYLIKHELWEYLEEYEFEDEE